MRLDKFLKVSRLIKRRTVANDVAEQGRIFVNDKLAKPAKQLKVGDIIKIEPYQWDSSKIENGAGVTWTISHTKTGGVIAKGEFIAIPM